jgi:hypothetical protein
LFCRNEAEFPPAVCDSVTSQQILTVRSIAVSLAEHALKKNRQLMFEVTRLLVAFTEYCLKLLIVPGGSWKCEPLTLSQCCCHFRTSYVAVSVNLPVRFLFVLEALLSHLLKTL